MMLPKQPQSYAEMFQMAMWEIEKRTDEYFEMKKKEFDEYVDDKLKQDVKCCEGGPQWGHSWNCKNQLG